MSEGTDRLLDSDGPCHNLAEELLREMPDMKDEIEQELKDALSKNNDSKIKNMQQQYVDGGALKKKVGDYLSKPHKDLETTEDFEESMESGEVANNLITNVTIESCETEKAKTEIMKMDTDYQENNHGVRSIDSVNENNDENVDQTSQNESENNTKTETNIRKRENECSESVSTILQDGPTAKQAKLEVPGERKSIIEVHISNKGIDNEEETAELERIRKLKEQTVIELHRLKSQEDKLLRIENINKQLQKNIEQKREQNEANESEDNNGKEDVALEKEEFVSNDMDIETSDNKKLTIGNADGNSQNGISKDLPKLNTDGKPCYTHDNSQMKKHADVLKESANENIKATTLIEIATTSVQITSTVLNDNSNHSNMGEHENHTPPEELTTEEADRDRELRASGDTFLQHLPCFKLQHNSESAARTISNDNVVADRAIPRCRECRRRNSQGGSDVYCRFYEFRRLQYNEMGELVVSGFPNPYTDPTADDLRIWQPDDHSVPTAGWMDIQVARYILLHAGDQFCYLWQQEAEALRLHENPNSIIAWKKVVQGLREICDVCDTTLFNFHWTCDKCGFGVCLDCFKDRKEQRSCRKRRTGDKTQRGHDEFHWMLCTATTPTHQKHELRDLMLTQIIASDALNVLGRLLHDIRAMWQVPQMCGCLLSKQNLSPDTELGILIQDMIKESQLKQQTSASSLATEETLRKQARMEELHAKKLEFARARGIDYVPGRVWTKQTLGKDPITTAFDNFKHINFLRKGLAGLRRFLPPRAMTLTHSTMLAPGVPHEWLCDGKLLRLTNAMHPDNRILFQEVWKCGQPVMISEVARSLNLDLWRPEAFCKDFGDKPNDLINCLNGNLVPNQPMRYFWEGFQCIKKRLLDGNGKPMLLKLKDWPPGDDFAEILPTRFADLMTGLPMPEYTLRTGNLNIASCLPKMFVPPDLGPKMYNAYGSALHPDKGTTNLHLDISDAVNIMVYVGVPQDADSKPQLVATQKAIALGGCDYLTRARCQTPDVLPGALWHIFPARDADKIRDLLNRVTIEKGFRLEPDHDPIHDQNWYLDDKLRARLFKEYGVEGYPIVQCLGDAVFIPAGAPHQVQNLHNCIKVAEDFVSPENITHCYHLTHEFRHLSHSHTNHEDKLQIKNIIYHAIKDCCHILVRALDQRLDEELAKVEAQHAKAEMSLRERTELEAKLHGNK
ncbi:lysine-specific demethylase 3A [Bactrocera tryoni]|uniref:lysine-specific demethylase 3A n=1 Tax=Bactrocera tryoni TaxID=59916 RepID=UPI001A96B0C9|nr:lysine-specific demethylase 3A [Bactrocera tryoni]XP_039970394.1 lysine-specific demethylase 3A [Bactrocera tryoni]XP_039970395.1 lysine-specific demethylase 3A [Bactrocera tryoni]